MELRRPAEPRRQADKTSNKTRTQVAFLVISHLSNIPTVAQSLSTIVLSVMVCGFLPGDWHYFQMTANNTDHYRVFCGEIVQQFLAAGIAMSPTRSKSALLFFTHRYGFS